MNNSKNRFKYILSPVLAYLITYGLFLCWRVDFYGMEFLFLSAFAVFTVLIYKAWNLREKRLCIGAAVIAALFGLSVTLGRKINVGDVIFTNFGLSDLLYGAVMIAAGYILFINVIYFICHREREFGTRIPATRKRMLIFFAVIALAWLPYYLIYFPGNLTPDSFVILNQILGETGYSNHHPLLFTLFIKLFIQAGLKLTGDINIAVGIYSFVQLLIFTGILSYAVNWLWRKGAPRAVGIASLLFFALNPIFGIYAVTMWKDIFFGAFVLLFVLLVYDIVESRGQILEKNGGLVRLAAVSLLVAFCRNNGIYILIVSFLAVFIYQRRLWKRLLPLFGGVLIMVGIVQGPVYSAAGVKDGDFAESLAIPLQQMVYSIKCGAELTEEQEEVLSDLMDIDAVVEAYDMYTVDRVKGHASFDNDYLNNNKGAVLKVWLQLLPANFFRYVKAWLMETRGFWNWGVENWVIRGMVGENSLGVEEINLFGVNLREYANNCFDFLRTQPVIRNLFSISFTFWTTVLYSIIMAVRKRYRYILPIIPLLALWATNMIATPVFCEFRYVFAFHLSWPFILITLTFKSKETNLPDTLK